MNSLCIKNIPERNRAEVLRRLEVLISRYVNNTVITIPYNYKLRKYAFVKLESKEDADTLKKSLDGLIFFNSELKVEYTYDKLSYKETKTIYIKLSEEINENELKNAIMNSLVYNVRYVKVKKIVLIDFKDKNESKKYFNEKNGKISLKGKTYKLECL
ncbi:hypothetical protein H312_00088 [Anncaliia algerae PRA339]|uniref:RRM domain-containing protein n=1 Tax=Anncaliia algerae PRA339 TaxID=1288291 RepID=A0A059F5F6_9MICR|nr:hypothetical protein H312_00088 [Anncaliia algerae PRA339]